MGKKLLIYFLVLVISVIITIGVIVIRPNIWRTCKIEKYNMSIRLPYAYEIVENKAENSLIDFYNEIDDISISAIDLKEDFWSSGDIVTRMDEYLNVISSTNYDTEFKNVKTEIVVGTEERLGRVEFDLAKNYGEEESKNIYESKAITLITNEEVGNVVIEILTPQESFEKNKEEIETIVQSINIKN